MQIGYYANLLVAPWGFQFVHRRRNTLKTTNYNHHFSLPLLLSQGLYCYPIPSLFPRSYDACRWTET